MVGHQTLDLSIGVQIPVPQVKSKARAGFFYFEPKRTGILMVVLFLFRIMQLF
jgi:hypothetical protein